MAKNPYTRRTPSCKSLMLVLLLTLVGFLSACSASTTTGTTHPCGSTPTSTRGLKGTISEFPLPSPNFRPGDITAGLDGNLWFTEPGTKPQTGMIGCITPAGIIREFPLPANSFSNSITAGPDGNLWFKEPGKIGRITPAGTISEFPLSASSFVDITNWPATLYGSTLWGDITMGPDSAIWFTEPGTNTRNGKIGRITTSGAITEYPIPTSNDGPWGITTGPDGNLWFTAVDSHIFRGVIGRITPSGMVTLFPLPSGFFSLHITAGPDGNLWFTEADLDGRNDKIGRITPSGTLSEFPLPDPNSHLNGITAGPDNAIWFTEDMSNHAEKGKIGRITLTGTISEFPLPTPSGGPGGITVGPGGTLWFTELLSNKIGHLV